MFPVLICCCCCCYGFENGKEVMFRLIINTQSDSNGNGNGKMFNALFTCIPFHFSFRFRSFYFLFFWLDFFTTVFQHWKKISLFNSLSLFGWMFIFFSSLFFHYKKSNNALIMFFFPEMDWIGMVHAHTHTHTRPRIT